MLKEVRDRHGSAVAQAPLRDRCPICTSAELSDKYAVNDFTITRCGACDLRFVREELTQGDLVPYYQAVDEDYIYNDPVNADNLRFYFNSLKPLIENRVPGKGRLLDIGCSAAVFLDLMDGWERHGIEFPGHAGEIARSKFGDNIHFGTIETYGSDTKRGYFDCITLLDSFDHMLDPVDILQRVRDMLRPGGLLVIKVHESGGWYAKISGKSLYSIIPPYHMFFYTKRSLLGLLKRVDMKVVDTRYMPQIIALKTIPFRLAKSMEGNLLYKLFQFLEKRRIGQLKIRKNLGDLITTFSIKEA